MSTTRESDIAKPSASTPKESTRILPIKPFWRRYCVTVQRATLSFVRSIIYSGCTCIDLASQKITGLSSGTAPRQSE